MLLAAARRLLTRLQHFVSDHPHELLERLAEDVAALILSEFHAPWVRVQLAKLAPLPGVRQLGVRIERGVRPGRGDTEPRAG